MQYDSGVDKISEWVTLNVVVTGDISIEDVLPFGWKRLAEPLDTAAFTSYDLPLFNGTIFISIEKGLLRARTELKYPNYQDVFNRVTQSVSVQSSLLCMVCGKRGCRRKPLEGWPSLCTLHHVQYVNYLDELTHGTESI